MKDVIDDAGSQGADGAVWTAGEIRRDVGQTVRARFAAAQTAHGGTTTCEQANALIGDLAAETDRFWRRPKTWKVARAALLRAILALENDLWMTLNKPRPPAFPKPREPLRDSA